MANLRFKEIIIEAELITFDEILVYSRPRYFSLNILKYNDRRIVITGKIFVDRRSLDRVLEFGLTAHEFGSIEVGRVVGAVRLEHMAIASEIAYYG